MSSVLAFLRVVWLIARFFYKLNNCWFNFWWVVKAQVHAGGRGKGGGVKLAKSLDEVKSIANNILGMHLVTPQTLPRR